MIELKNLSHKYIDTEYSLKPFSLKLNRGEYISIVGSNGSGKSTLALILAGIIKDYEGEYLINDKKPTASKIRKTIGILFQNPENQLIASIVKNDIAFGLENFNIPKEKMDMQIDNVLKNVGMLRFKELPISTLSGGEKQKIAFAGILALNFDVLIFDEVTSMLDEESAEKIMDIIKEQHKLGKTIILISHKSKIIKRADRIVYMDEN